MISALIVALSATGARALAVRAGEPAVAPPAGSKWDFAGCMSTYGGAPGMFCVNMFGVNYADSYSILQGGATDIPGGFCQGGSSAVWCAVNIAPPLPSGKCVRSCEDGGRYVRVVEDAEHLVCLGHADNACSWYTNDACTALYQESKPATQFASAVACPINVWGSPSAAWCKAAYNQVYNNYPKPYCSGIDDVAPPTPDTYCTAPPPGPSYGGSGYTCIQDVTTKSWVPVKLTASGDTACMSRNSRDCIWAQPQDKSCCDKLVSTSSPNTPYFSCGEIHNSVWDKTGYEESDSWCNQGRQVLAPSQPTETGRGCVVTGLRGQCTYFRYTTIAAEAQNACNDIGNFEPAGTTQFETVSTGDCGYPTQGWTYSCLLVNNARCANNFPVKITWVRAPKADNTCQFYSPNNSADIAVACRETCGQDNSGKAYVATECRGENKQEFWCKCAARSD